MDDLFGRNAAQRVRLCSAAVISLLLLLVLLGAVPWLLTIAYVRSTPLASPLDEPPTERQVRPNG